MCVRISAASALFLGVRPSGRPHGLAISRRSPADPTPQQSAPWLRPSQYCTSASPRGRPAGIPARCVLGALPTPFPPHPEGLQGAPRHATHDRQTARVPTRLTRICHRTPRSKEPHASSRPTFSSQMGSPHSKAFSARRRTARTNASASPPLQSRRRYFSRTARRSIRSTREIVARKAICAHASLAAQFLL